MLVLPEPTVTARPFPPMRILHLEDNAHDAELFGADLHAEWPHCEIEVVTNREGFIAEIARRHYDLVLSDFSLGGFDGLTALRFVREHSPNTPFIFLSGSIGEERAVEAMRSGAV